MSKSSLSAGEPGADRCSESGTGPELVESATWRDDEWRMRLAIDATCQSAGIAQLVVDELVGDDRLALYSMAVRLVQLNDAILMALDDERQSEARVHKLVHGGVPRHG